MPQSEFDIIEHFFLQQKISRDDVKLGIGDDAAIVSVPQNTQLVIALDTLVSGVHFPTDTSAEDIAYKALAVNLSDLAAMGAEPAWFTLALTIPESNKDWLTGFAKGLFTLADKYNMQLIGGDTTQGPLTVSIQVAGYIPEGQGIKRSGAKAGDNIYVTGTLGDAAFGLFCIQEPDKCEANQQVIKLLNRPKARIEIGIAIREIASACIDISDGLLADLTHILEKSKVGALIDRQQIPLSGTMQKLCNMDENSFRFVLSGGDDYELCFTAPASRDDEIKTIAGKLGVSISCIGKIETEQGVRLHHDGQACSTYKESGYEHFK